MTKFIHLNTFNVKVILCFLFIGAMRTSFGQCYSVQVAQPNCSGDLGQIQYSVLGCGCNYSTNGPWVFRIGTTPNFSNASAIFTSSLTSNPVFVFSNLPAGTYYVRAHYNNSTTKCTGSELSVVISSPPQIQLSSTLTSSSIDLTVTGGTPGYTYSWSNGATTEDLSNLSPGTYSVVVYDLNGCTETASYTVQNQNPVLSVNWAISHILCFGDQNGMINLTVAGGNAPYNVSWTGPVFGNPAGNEIANSGGSYLIANMPAGTYTITITDSNGNSTNISATITQPQSPLTLLTITTNNLCFGAQTGAIDLTVSGGTGIYAYSWNTGAITQDITGLAAGLYMVTVIDANGCTATTVATITQPQSPLTLTTTQVNVLCNGANTGSINLTPTGGTAPYMYLWSNGSTVQDPQNLAAGTYSVGVTDANGCTAFASAVITQPANPLSASYSQWDVTCNGLSNGAIDVTVTGGSQPYTYAWSHGPTTEDLTGLSAGTYNLTITYAQQCTSSLSVTITEPPALSLSTNESNVSCNSGGNGSIDLSVSGGTAPYTYLWNNGSFSQDINNLSTGTYTVTVTDANGCTAMTVATITQPSAILLSGSINGNNIDITVTGGIPGYTYSWSNGAITQDLTNLSPGTYTVTVTDANNCTVTASYTIQNQNPPLSVTSAISPVLCAGGQDGSIIVTVAGGNGPYNVSWTGPVSGNPAGNEIANSGGSYLIANMPAGIYSVTVTDANGTLDIIQLVITQPTPIVTSYNIASVTCYGGNDGSIFLTISGGVPSYYLQWSNGSNSQNLSNLSAGVYNFIITDANNCTMQGSINITQPPLLTITGTTSNNNIDISISGGTAPYVYLWSNGATTQDLTNLSPGIYAVSVTDANGCLISQSFTIQNQNPPLSVTSAISPVSCAGGQDGSIIVTAAGGNAPYNLSWTGPVVGNPAGNEIANSGGSYLIANMPAGTYTITITDSNGNSTNISATITQPSTIQVAAAVTGVACNGNSTGAIDLTVSGGTGAYTYLWSNGATTEDISSLPSATYNVTVTDVNGCTVQASTTITQPQSPLTLTTTQVNVLCNGASTGSVNLTVSGGTAGYSYLWSNGSTGEDLTGLPAGTYSVTVTDANGCTAMTVATITEPLPILLTGSVNGNNIDISVSGGTVPYNYSWSSGDVTQDLANVSSGTYSVTVTDAFNCSITDTFIVNNVGLEQQESIELQVFPNPAQDMVTIRSSSTGIGNTYRMLDCYGRNVLEGTLTSQENNINIQTLANGVYHVKCGSETRALVISH
jgi:hypothetical protein